ncbi:MAG: hypothetical protein ACPG31_10525 [Planctomycetota bacterium]
MNFVLKIILVGALLTVGWSVFQSCSSLEGQSAPPLTGGTLISDGIALADASLPETDWRLLAFFSPG